MNIPLLHAWLAQDLEKRFQPDPCPECRRKLFESSILAFGAKGIGIGSSYRTSRTNGTWSRS
eukprot:9499144-Pyramimonas_sp.AAC.1